MTAAGRLGVGIVGAGRVGPVLGAALAGTGHAVVGVATVSDEGRERVEALLPGAPVLDIRDPRRAQRARAARRARARAARTGGRTRRGRCLAAGQLVVHTAPGSGAGVLAPATAAGAIPLAINPAMAFTGTSIDLTRLRSAYCAVTGPGPVLPIGQALAVEMGCEPVVIAEGDRIAWAAALRAVVDPLDTIVRSSAALLRRSASRKRTACSVRSPARPSSVP